MAKMSMINRDTKYQYLRLYDGKELFAMVKEIDNLLELHFPMNIILISFGRTND